MAMETQTVIDRICKIQTKMHSQRKKKERSKQTDKHTGEKRKMAVHFLC